MPNIVRLTSAIAPTTLVTSWRLSPENLAAIHETWRELTAGGRERVNGCLPIFNAVITSIERTRNIFAWRSFLLQELAPRGYECKVIIKATRSFPTTIMVVVYWTRLDPSPIEQTIEDETTQFQLRANTFWQTIHPSLVFIDRESAESLVAYTLRKLIEIQSLATPYSLGELMAMTNQMNQPIPEREPEITTSNPAPQQQEIEIAQRVGGLQIDIDPASMAWLTPPTISTENSPRWSQPSEPEREFLNEPQPGQRFIRITPKKSKSIQSGLAKAAKGFVEELGIPRMKKMADRLL